MSIYRRRERERERERQEDNQKRPDKDYRTRGIKKQRTYGSCL